MNFLSMWFNYKIISSFFLVLLFGFSSDNQKIKIAQDVKLFDIDITGSPTVVIDNKLLRYSSDFENTLFYENLSMGDISIINAFDGLNIMVFYADIQSVLFLDNQLSVKRSPILLSQFGYDYVNLVCLSYNTGFWVYNPSDFSLQRYDRFLNLSHSSGNISTLVNKDFNPFSLKESGNYLVLNDKAQGLVVFDLFGALKKNIPISNIEDWQINGSLLHFLRADTLFSYDLKFNVLDTVQFLSENSKSFKILNNDLFVLTSSGDLYKSDL